MGRNSKLIFLVITSLVCIAIGYSIYVDINKPKKIEKKEVISFIEDFSMKANIDSGGFYRLKAKKAYLFLEQEKVDFEGCDFYYYDLKKEISGVSDKCFFERDKQVVLEKNVAGSYNNLKITTKEDSKLVYDIKKASGFVTGEVMAMDDRNFIRSNRLNFDKDKVYVEFIGNVEVKYEK
ncbi:MAG: LPS export ABC transporter periplasmic protein LptC [Calditerrivibrio sp.]|nr:LPS export ABC transporter periplasmic protein LptC [Calditerrivibrio sp.]